MRYLSLILLLMIPLAWSYPIKQYTGGNVYIPPGKEVNLILPFPEGKNCLPVAVLWVRGGYDYPVLTINGHSFIGEGMHRTVLEGNVVIISVRSSQPATIEGNSLIYCTRDPFVFIEYVPPVPIKVGNFNFIDVVIKNYGYSPVEVNVLWDFHPDVTPFFVPPANFTIPARKEGTRYSFVATSLFLVSVPLLMKPSSHQRLCIKYKDSLMTVKDCDGPVPTYAVINPRIVCVGSICYNTSNIEIEINGVIFKPGDQLSKDIIMKLKNTSPDIEEITLKYSKGKLEDKKSFLGGALVSIGVLFAGLVSVLFKYGFELN